MVQQLLVLSQLLVFLHYNRLINKIKATIEWLFIAKLREYKISSPIFKPIITETIIANSINDKYWRIHPKTIILKDSRTNGTNTGPNGVSRTRR